MTPATTITDLLTRHATASGDLTAAVKQRFPFGSPVNLPLPAGDSGSVGRVIGFLPKDPTVVCVDITPDANTSRTVYLPVAVLLAVNPVTSDHQQAEPGNIDLGGEG